MMTDEKELITQNAFAVLNPFTQEKVADIPIMTEEQIQKDLEDAYAFKTTLNAGQRAKILRSVAQVLRDDQETCAKIITQEAGLSLKDTLYEVGRVANCAEFAALMAERIDEDITNDFILKEDAAAPQLNVVSEPLDLVVGITPFNHPMNQVAHKIFPAIAAGTAIVLKPSEKTPLSALKLAELLYKEGLEPQMLKVVTGAPAESIANQLISSPLADMITFTGGLEVGLKIKEQMVRSGNGLKKYVPELGGCSSLIINDDADIAESVKVTINGCFKNSGQRCTAIRRVIVVGDIVDQYLDALHDDVMKIKYGNPMDEHTQMGTVINEDAAKMIEDRVNKAIVDGAKLVLGNLREGALYSPTVLDHVSINSELVAKETFGPVCPIIRVSTIDEAIELANQTNYRLAGAVMTKDEAIAKKVADALVVGQFNWNGIPGYRTEAAPFGGFQDSGNGEKEGIVLATQGMRRLRTFYKH